MIKTMINRKSFKEHSAAAERCSLLLQFTENFTERMEEHEQRKVGQTFHNFNIKYIKKTKHTLNDIFKY